MSMPKNRKRLPLSKKTRTTKRDVVASAVTTDVYQYFVKNS